MHLPGIADDEFLRDKVPMTKEEIRILTLCKAKIRPDSIVWDIGAGTGSLSVEAAMLAVSGHVFAVEKNPLAVELLHKNAAKFNLENKITVVEGQAPDALENLPACDAVLIGGSGRQMNKILDVIDSRLKDGGRIVANAVTVQTIAQITEYMTKRDDYAYEAVLAQINRLRRVGPYDMFSALNPVYIVTCTKRSKGDNE